ncbi:MAG: hypothetical protein NTZ51_07740 [Proteobacteria bacterium]|nr:hypothetical protein [Pseudomonadota bacterium]
MKELSVKGYYLPEPLQKEVSSFSYSLHEFPDWNTVIRVEFPVVTPDLLEKVIAFLKHRKPYLEKKSVEEIADILDRASELWLNDKHPRKQAAVEAISLFTGFSPEMVRESIRVEHLSSRKEDLLRAICSEIGDPAFLDRFHYSPERRCYSRAFGPDLTAAIFSSNIPGLPHLSVMRSLLVKSPIIGKASREEPIFPPLYAETLKEIDPEIGNCLAILSWRGGDEAIEDVLFSHSGVVIVYGSEATCNSVCKRVTPGTRVISHSHRIGFGAVGREALNKKTAADLAGRIAYDVCTFDQFACISPQIYFLEEGGEVSPKQFVTVLAAAMTALEKKFPPAQLNVEDAAVLRHLCSSYELRELGGEDISLQTADNLSWTVVYEPLKEFVSSPLHRFIRIVPLKDLKDISSYLEPIKGYMQNAGLEVADKRRPEMLNLLAGLGVSRICPPGKMPTPSMMWHHDGLPCLGEMVRWTDAEMF